MENKINKIQPIETKYKGYNFRSRLEARWAVYFDTIKLKWEYEKEGYQLSNGIRYLPDFYIDNFGFIEIKGTEPNDEELEKVRLLSEDLKTKCAIFVGIPHTETQGYRCFEDGKEICEMSFNRGSVNKWGQIPYYGEIECYYPEDINKARSARFEFGDVGND